MPERNDSDLQRSLIALRRMIRTLEEHSSKPLKFDQKGLEELLRTGDVVVDLAITITITVTI